MAELHHRLQQDCLLVGRFRLCHLLLMQDANYPWCILVPDRDGVTEIHHLDDADRLQLIQESSCLSLLMEKQFRADKINIAALGNVVPQLHVHHVVRYQDDPAWPDPVWGRVPVKPYSRDALASVIRKLCEGLPDEFRFGPAARLT